MVASASKNPLAHVDIKTVKSYDGQGQLSKPVRVVVYDFAVSPDVVKTDRMPGVRQRMKGNSKKDIAKQVQAQMTKDLVNSLTKQLKKSGIPVEKGTPGMDVSGSTLTVRGTITKINAGHRMRRGTVGLGVGASDVETDCQIAVEANGQSVLLSELKTVAKSGKKPGAGVTMGVGAAPAVAVGATGATAHKSTAQGDSARTGSALGKRAVELMKKQGWVTAANQQQASADGQSQ
jgi:hypothetical protein